jgi:hypothetical protein
MPADPVLQLLRDHDPAATAAPPAPGLLADARRRAAGGSPRPPRRRRAVAVLAGLAIVATTLGVLAADPRPPDAAAALRSAADRTGSADSGRMTWEVTDSAADGRVLHHVRSLIRWDGADFHTMTTYDGTPDEHRHVDGRRFERRAGGAWRELEPGPPASVVSDHARSRLGDRALLDLLRAAASVERTELDGGGERYTGSVSATQLAKSGGPAGLGRIIVTRPRARAETDAARARGQLPDEVPAPAPPSDVDVSATTDAEDRVVEVVLTQRHGGIETVVRTAFAALGEPQGITAP